MQNQGKSSELTTDSHTKTHVLFDFFGTLVDYNPGIHPTAYNAPLQFATRLDVHMKAHEIDELWSQAWHEKESEAIQTGRECSMEDIARRFAMLINREDVASAQIDIFIQEYLDVWARGIQPRVGALDMLAELTDTHHLSIVSNTHSAALVPKLVRLFGFEPHLSAIFTSIEIGWRKPHPNIFTEVLRCLDVAPTQVIFVGDNWEADIDGPAQAGMTPLYVGKPAPGMQPIQLQYLGAEIRRSAVLRGT